MKQSATEKKTNSAKSKAQSKTSANITKKAKLSENSVAIKKNVSAKSVKPRLMEGDESKKNPPKIQKVKPPTSVKKIIVTKTVLPKTNAKKTPITANTKLTTAKKTETNIVSKKTENKISAKTKIVFKTNLKTQNKPKTQTVKSALPKNQKEKTVKILVKTAKPKIRTTKKIEPKTSAIKSKSLKSKTEKPKVVKVPTTKTETSKSKSTVAKKSTPKNTKPSVAKKKILTPNIVKNVKQISKSKAKKSVEKTPINKAKTNITAAKKSVKTVKAKALLVKPKTPIKTTKTVAKKSSAKSVSKPKVVKAETKGKSVEKTVKPKKAVIKASASSKRKNILAFAKPAITGKIRSERKVSAKKEIVLPKIEPKIEKIEKPKRKSVRAISQAVFRGEKDFYQFKVYEINENFKEIPAVYVISKRFTDRRNRGHHKLICIGETDSVIKDLKNHRKNKCLRTNKANVISILQEEDKEKRLQIETDLKAAHSIVCNLQQ